MGASRRGFNLLTRAGWSNLRVCKADMKMVWKDTVGPLTCLAMFGHKPYLSGTDIGCSRCGQYLAFPWYNPGDPKADRGLYRMYLIQICETYRKELEAGKHPTVFDREIAYALIAYCNIRTTYNVRGMLIGFDVPDTVYQRIVDILDGYNRPKGVNA